MLRLVCFVMSCCLSKKSLREIIMNNIPHKEFRNNNVPHKDFRNNNISHKDFRNNYEQHSLLRFS